MKIIGQWKVSPWLSRDKQMSVKNPLSRLIRIM